MFFMLSISMCDNTTVMGGPKLAETQLFLLPVFKIMAYQYRQSHNFSECSIGIQKN